MYFQIILSVLCITICVGADQFSVSGKVDDGTGQFAVAGRTVDGSTGQPLKNVLVELSCSNSSVKWALLTDVSGAFRFEGVSACAYKLLGQKPSHDNAIQFVKVGPSASEVVLKLNPLGVVRGRVSTTEREPAIGVAVRLWDSHVADGRRRFRSAAYAVTDDRGEYLLADVRPGAYVLHVAGKSGGTSTFVGGQPRRIGEEEAFAPVYYGGGTSLPNAATITVESGKELRSDISVTMRPAYAVTGMISGMTPYQPVSLFLLTTDLTGVPTRNSLNSATGEFRVADVVPGTYILRANTYSALARAERPARFEAVVPGSYRVQVDTSEFCAQAITAGTQNLLLEPEISVRAGVPPAPIDVVVAGSCGSIEAKVPDGTLSGNQKLLVLFPATGGEPIAAFWQSQAYVSQNILPGDYTAFLFPKNAAYAEPGAREKSGVRGQPVKVQAEGVTRIQLEVRP